MNLKKHYQSLSGQTVSQDYFLFHCLHAESELSQAIKSKDNLLLYSDWESLKINESFSDSLNSLILFYKDNHKSLFLEKALDYSHCADFVPSFIALKHDLEKLRKLPKPETEQKEEPKEDLKEEVKQESLSQDEPSVLEKESAAQNESEKGEVLEEQVVVAQEEPIAVDDKAEQKSPKELIEKSLEENFPKSFSYMIDYISWADKKRKPREVLDYKIVPPIGRYVQRVKREFSHLFPADSGSSFDGEKRYGNRDFSNYKSNKDSRKRTSVSVEEKQALEEVDAAIKKMEKSPDVKVINLKPRSSSVRMLQHKRISRSEGFVSHSVGESPNRAIQIKRT